MPWGWLSNVAKRKGDESEETTFESAMARLEEITQQLEAGQVPLDEMIATFREGMELVSFCSEKLQEAELTLEQLLGDEGQTAKLDPSDLDADRSEGEA
jgi:exodeoxyribonuclease VII small subunit